MKNKIWATFAFAAIFCSASCAEDDTFAFNPDYNTQDGYTPDGIASWPQAIFCFDDNRCTEVEMAPSQAALRGIETSGNRATALAFASQDNLSFTNTSTGAHSTEYILRMKIIDAYTTAVEQLSILRSAAEAKITSEAQYRMTEVDFVKGKLDAQTLSRQKSLENSATREYEQVRRNLNDALLRLEILTHTPIINKPISMPGVSKEAPETE